MIAVDRKVIEVAGHLYLKAPKNRKRRRTIYPRAIPVGYPLAGRLAPQAGHAAPAARDRACITTPAPAGCICSTYSPCR